MLAGCQYHVLDSISPNGASSDDDDYHSGGTLAIPNTGAETRGEEHNGEEESETEPGLPTPEPETCGVTVTTEPSAPTNDPPTAAGWPTNSDSGIVDRAAPVEGSQASATAEPLLPRSFLRSFLLLTLDRADRSYGYELFETVQAQGLTTDLAGVYRALRSMQRHGLVTSVWEPSASGPDRRVYALSDEGRRAAAAAVWELSEVRDALSVALSRFNTTDGQQA